MCANKQKQTEINQRFECKIFQSIDSTSIGCLTDYVMHCVKIKIINQQFRSIQLNFMEKNINILCILQMRLNIRHTHTQKH